VTKVKSAELRDLARRKLSEAEVARRIGPGLSDAERESMRLHAQDLEAEAAALEFQADALDARR
jgi:hypothetical protein